jgi:hypothetical protein
MNVYSVVKVRCGILPTLMYRKFFSSNLNTYFKKIFKKQKSADMLGGRNKKRDPLSC